MGKDLDAMDFKNLLPASISGDQTMAAAADALADQLAAVHALKQRLILFAAIDVMNEPLLSAMAWQLHVDYWPDDFTVAQKRNAVARGLIRHQLKGTPAVVEEAMADVLGNAQVLEWHAYGGDPYYFRIETTGDLGSDFLYRKKLLPALAATKNARSWLDRITVRRQLSGTLDIKLSVAKQERRLTIGMRLALDCTIWPQVAIIPMIFTRLTISVRQ